MQVGGNRMFKMLYDMNFTYDSSMPVYENKPPSWPYTLDYKIFHDCMIPPCPTKSYPGKGHDPPPDPCVSLFLSSNVRACPTATESDYAIKRALPAETSGGVAENTLTFRSRDPSQTGEHKTGE